VTGGLLAVVYGVLERNLWSGLVGAALLVAFWFIEKRSSAPLAPIHLLTSRTVRWGNLGGFVIFAIEPATVFLMTLYFRSVLELSPLATGLLFGIPGLASVAAGVIAGRLIGRIGQRRALVGGLALQGATAIPLIFVGLDPAALAFVIPVLFVNFFVHVSAIVAFMVVATSGVPNDDQGLATGLTSMTQQVGITIGVPILAAIATSQAVLLTGIQLGLAIGAGLVLLMSVLVAVGLRDRRPVKALA
jgi:predicted MFS family arabinose efflux permease